VQSSGSLSDARTPELGGGFRREPAFRRVEKYEPHYHHIGRPPKLKYYEMRLKNPPTREDWERFWQLGAKDPVLGAEYVQVDRTERVCKAYQVRIWHSESTEIREEVPEIISIGWWEIHLFYVWGGSRAI
jgi:hypothetical protein